VIPRFILCDLIDPGAQANVFLGIEPRSGLPCSRYPEQRLEREIFGVEAQPAGSEVCPQAHKIQGKHRFERCVISGVKGQDQFVFASHFRIARESL
jgi:hypothetical protein